MTVAGGSAISGRITFTLRTTSIASVATAISPQLAPVKHTGTTQALTTDATSAASMVTTGTS